MTNAMRLISRHEGRRAAAYQDSLGFWTIGVGHLIDARKGGKLSEAIIDAVLVEDIAAQTTELVHELPGLAELDEVRFAALLDMEFSLEYEGLKHFPLLMLAIHKKDWNEAAKQVLNSKWATQVGKRAVEIAEMLRTGQWQQ